MSHLNDFRYGRFTSLFLAGVISIITLTASLGAPPSRAQPPAPFAILDGVGILSDSNLDEYQGTDNRGGSYHAHTFNMIELLVMLRGFNLGDWGSRPEPRRTGFEYNWARSGATSRSLISAGQHTGLAAQVAAGNVSFVMLHIGSNDFSPYVGDAYQEACYMSDSDLLEKVNTAIADVTLATDTILNAGPEGMIVTLFPYWDDVDPIVEVICPEPARRQRIRQAVDAINQGILLMAQTRPIGIVDPAEVVLAIFARLENGFLDVGGELIDFTHKGNEPHHAQLEDVSGHAGTVLSGLLANGMWIEPLNQNFGTNITPLSDAEILQAAGITITLPPPTITVPPPTITVPPPYHKIYIPNVTKE